MSSRYGPVVYIFAFNTIAKPRSKRSDKDYKIQCVVRSIRAHGLECIPVRMVEPGYLSTFGKEYLDQFGNAWQTFERDADSPKVGSRLRSSALLDWLHSVRPRAIILKGSYSEMLDDIAEMDSILVIDNSGEVNHRSLRRLVVADIVLAESEAQRKAVARYLPREHVLRLPNQNPECFEPADVAKTYDIAVISSFVPLKNHKALIPLKKHPLRIAMLGTGALENQVREEWSNAAAKVDFLGYLESCEVARVLQRCRLLVHPSLSEGFPRVVVEAFAVGVPVVGLKGVLDDPVSHKSNGLLVREHQIERAVIELLNAPDRLSQMARNARSTFERHYSRNQFESTISSLTEIIRSLENRPLPRRNRQWPIRIATLVTSPFFIARSARDLLVSNLPESWRNRRRIARQKPGARSSRLPE